MISNFPSNFKTVQIFPVETASRVLFGKFVRVESCNPVSFGFLSLWQFWQNVGLQWGGEEDGRGSQQSEETCKKRPD